MHILNKQSSLRLPKIMPNILLDIVNIFFNREKYTNQDLFNKNENKVVYRKNNMEKIIKQTIEIINTIRKKLCSSEVQQTISVNCYPSKFTIGELCEKRKDIPKNVIYFIIQSLSGNLKLTDDTEIILTKEQYTININKAEILIEKANSYSYFLNKLFEFTDKNE